MKEDNAYIHEGKSVTQWQIILKIYLDQQISQQNMLKGCQMLTIMDRHPNTYSISSTCWGPSWHQLPIIASTSDHS